MNRLFLLYLAMLSLAAWSAGTLLWRTDMGALGRLIPVRAPVRLAAGYMWAVVMLNEGTWLVRILDRPGNPRGCETWEDAGSWWHSGSIRRSCVNAR